MLSTAFASYFNGALSKHYRGVFAADKIPKGLAVKGFIICNTANSDNQGKHWFIVYRSSKSVIECFDSLGITIEKQNVLKDNFQYPGIKKLKFNYTQVQSNETNTCGQFCIFFIYQRLFNADLPFDELLNTIFSDDVSKNESEVETFVSNL